MGSGLPLDFPSSLPHEIPPCIRVIGAPSRAASHFTRPSSLSSEEMQMHQQTPSEGDKALRKNPRGSFQSSSRAFKYFSITACLLGLWATGFAGAGGGELPEQIRAIMQKDRYAEATWALKVIDVKSGEVIYDLNSQETLL